MFAGVRRVTGVAVANDWNDLLRGSELTYGRAIRGQSRLDHKETVIVEIAIHHTSDFRSLGAESRTAAFEEDDDDNVTNVSFCVGGKPSEACACMGASTGLAQNFLLAEICAEAAGGAELYSAFHSIRNLGDERGDVEVALYHRLEICDVLGSRRMLQVIERAAIGDGRDQRAEW